MIRTHSLPPDTIERVRRSIQPLESFPEIGPALRGRWSAFRFILGPLRWMLIVYRYDPDRDVVAIVTVQDARGSQAATQPET